ncbi:hypothetical protein OK016_25190 [Vibrio chagasii]|nr:hypothetical protein [Vibrio chagasii]
MFDAAISGNNVNITFYKAIDQEAGLNSIQTSLVIEGLQKTDSDGTTELVIGHLPIVIKIHRPLIFDESYQMVEGEVASVNVLNNDIDLDTQLTIKSVEVDGMTKTIINWLSVSFTTSEVL